MKVLITGGGGQLATALQQAQIDQTIERIVLSQNELDITNRSDIESTLLRHQPSCIINTAAYTAVDQAEQETDLAYLVNRDGSRMLAKCCARSSIPLIHISTDYVFDGKQKKPYQETDQTNPLSIYGKSKLDGEEMIRRYLPQHIIIRTSGVFSEHGTNFVKTILKLAREKKTLKVVSDQITCPTPAHDLATAILTITAQMQPNMSWGTFHYSSSNPTSWFNFAKKIIDEAKKNQNLPLQNLEGISTNDFGSLAPRPLNAVLNCDKIHKVFGISQRPWQIDLQRVIEVLTHDLSS